MSNLKQKNNSDSTKEIITRIAPSPTGVLHIGTARTALFNYLFAKKHGGKFILRIEDTDTERSTKEFEKDIVDGIKKLGMEYDAFYRQSERLDIYKDYLQKLLDSGKAYISKESEGTRPEVIRLKNPNKKITFKDMIRGDITFDTSELGDFVIAKSLTEPLYHLAVVVDDYEMGITHVIRGDDGISNTPRQILLQEAIGADTPKYAHLPLILGKDKSKLSKRHGATSMNDFWNRGYLTESIINQLAFLGWNPGTNQEIYSMSELIKDFTLEKVQKGGAVFDEEKLKWFNHEYLQKITDDEFLELYSKYFKNFNSDDEFLLKLKYIILERITNSFDLEKMIETGEYNYFFIEPTNYDANDLIWKTSDPKKTILHLEKLLSIIEQFDENITEDIAKDKIWEYANENGRGDVLWPLRFALTGVNKSPDPFKIMSIIGKQRSINRIIFALNQLKKL